MGTPFVGSTETVIVLPTKGVTVRSKGTDHPSVGWV